MHCHILEHEDQGAMTWADVTFGYGPPAFPDPANQSALYDQDVNGDCIASASCTPTEDPEVSCNDGLDNDCDNLIDAADPDCAAPPVDCSQYGDRDSCRANSSCRWFKKKNECVAK
jgi:hypothetical protein